MAELTHPQKSMGDKAREVKQDAGRQARHAMRAASPWIAMMARAGYAAKGVVYTLVGALALMAAFGSGRARGSQSALGTLLDEPFGQVILAVVAIGLAGYALWCFVRAVWDPEDDGNDAKGIGKRVVSAIKGVIHAALVVAVVQMILGSGGGGGDEGAKDWTATLMAWPLGRWIVILAGLIIVGYGIQQIYRAWKADLDDQLKLGQLGPALATLIRRLSRFGMAARGAVFAVVGTFLVLAGWRVDPSEAKGVGEALTYVQGKTYGPWLLTALALGLIAYGLYEFVRARYRRIDAA